MKTLPSGLAAHIAGGTTTLADLLKITRTDGTVFAFTSAADDVTISSVLYKSAQGLNISSLEASAGLNVDNLELSTLDDGTVFTKLDVLSGRWRNADFVISRYNWASPSDGVDVRMVGTIGEVRLHRGYVTAELRGLQQYLQQPIGSVSSKTCRARLGDSACGVAIGAYQYAATVASVTNNQTFMAVGSGGSGDGYYASVSLLLHADGINGSTTFTDNSPTPKTVTAVGGAQISTTQNKFGGSSLYFDGTGDYATIPNHADFNLGTGDFTLEAWVYPIAAAVSAGETHYPIMGTYGSFTSPNSVEFVWIYSPQLGGKFALSRYQAGTSVLLQGSVVSITYNTWQHWACVRSAGVVTFYVNGVSAGGGSFTSNLSTYNQTFVINGMWGGTPAFSAQWAPNGYMDDIRITKGVARYTGTFTPSTSAWPNSAGAGAFPAVDGWLDNGLATWTSGANNGLSVKVKTFSASGSITLSLPMLATVTAGDTLTVTAGCQKRLVEDCATKFDNVLNFVGEPHLPGIDEVVQ